MLFLAFYVFHAGPLPGILVFLRNLMNRVIRRYQLDSNNEE